MENIILTLENMDAYNLCISIVAINMTIIGLTSIAESKSVIGADYSTFLIKKFRVLKYIRIYHLLIVFAAINILALITMSFDNLVIQSITLILVLVSAILAMVYFFSCILVTNEAVEKAIYIDVMSMCYRKDDNILPKFEPDKIANMKPGVATDKQIPNHVFAYFNEYDSDRATHFKKLFGPDSFLYDKEYHCSPYSTKMDGNEFLPYDYDGEYTNKKGERVKLHHISYEYMMLLRNSEIPEIWGIEILKNFYSYGKDCPEFQVDCLNRVLGIINQFCPSGKVNEYKFMQNLLLYTKPIRLCKSEEKIAYAYKQLLIAVQKMLLYSFNDYSKQEAEKVVGLLFGEENSEQFSVLSLNETLDLAIDVLKNDADKDVIQDLLAYIVFKYEERLGTCNEKLYERKIIKERLAEGEIENGVEQIKLDLFLKTPRENDNRGLEK